GRPARGPRLGDEHLDLGLALADGEEVVVGLLGGEVAAVGPVRASLVELEAELLAQHLPGLLDRVGDETDVVDVDESHGAPPLVRLPGGDGRSPRIIAPQPGVWQTASTLLPSGSRTNAP